MLAVWLPLNGDLTNNGLENVTISGSGTFTADGKIGKCLSNSGSAIIITSQTLVNSKIWSVCFWGYVVSANVTGNWIRLISMYDGGSKLRIEVCPKSYSNGVFCYSTHNNAAYKITTGGLSAPSGGFYDQWHHFCMTSDGTTICVYDNGTLRGTMSYNGSGAITGTFTLENNNIIKNNDFRIYNTCLSPLEVSELSKALVLHYPMTGGGRGQANLYDFESEASKWTNEGETSLTNYTDDIYGKVLKISGVASKRIYRIVSNVWITSGGKYTVSFLAKSSVNGATCDMSRSLADFAPTFTLTTGWKKYTGVITLTGTSSGGTLSFRTLYAADYYITQIKLEVGEIATAYIPGVGDSHYNSMGYNNNTEYDTSGYLHNGTINGNVSYSSDSARYSVSTEFSKAGYINVPSFNVDTSAFTLNFWVKMKTAISQHFVLGTFNSWTGNGIGIYRDANGVNYQCLQCLIRSAGESTYRSFVLGLSTGSWYMLTLTYDGTNYKGYLNGVIKQNATYGSGGVVSNPVFMVGNSKYNSTPASENEEAFVSDVRFYATALSAEDIQKLYNTSASLANNGTLMAYEFTEM